MNVHSTHLELLVSPRCADYTYQVSPKVEKGRFLAIASHASHAAVLILLLTMGCQAPRGVLNPITIRASTADLAERDALLMRWRLAIDLSNEFLASSFNRTLPADARLHLDPEGMRLVTPDQTMPIKLVLIDEYRSSSCVCATVDTHENVVFIRRPWRVSPELPIATCNTFFSHGRSVMREAAAGLAGHLLKMATILYYEKAAHISAWEWFKCQRLEWLLGSGHHRISMQRPNAVGWEFFYFWYGVEPATPSIKRILTQNPDAENRLERRSRETLGYRVKFRERLRERGNGSSAAQRSNGR